MSPPPSCEISCETSQGSEGTFSSLDGVMTEQETPGRAVETAEEVVRVSASRVHRDTVLPGRSGSLNKKRSSTKAQSSSLQIAHMLKEEG